MKNKAFNFLQVMSLMTLWFVLTGVSRAQAQPVKLVNRWKNEAIGIINGKPVSTATATDTWVIEKTGEGNFVLLKNATTGTYLHNQNGPLEAGAIQPGWWSAQWTMNAVDGHFQIINRWKGTYLHNQNGPLELGALGNPGWWSAQWKTVTTDDFHMIVASDTQYPWFQNIVKEPNDVDKAKRLSEQYNQEFLKTMNELTSQLGNVKGVIFNGDLTNFGHKWQLDRFKEIYSGLKAPMHVSLGNHDYANNVDDTYENAAANTMVEYMTEQLKAKNYPNSDYKVRDFFEGTLVTEISGSLSYSWDEGNVHFVQLQYYPLYEREWSNYVTIGAAKRKTVKITNSFQWLAADLAKARNAGKAIIVLFHDPYEHWSDLYIKGSKTEGATLKKRDDADAKSTELTNLLKTYQVSAVFGGHVHENHGLATRDYRNSGVPLFYSGSADYNHYLLTKFDKNKMTVEKVTSADGVVKRENIGEYPLFTPKPSTPVAVPKEDGYVTFFNEGGYVARYFLHYFQVVNGVKLPFVKATDNLSLGNKVTFPIPSDATDIMVTGQCDTVVKWADIFSQKYTAAPKVCIKTYGTFVAPKWNNECN
ncbi:metallophosphoesterase [Runella sp.]|uniref:metallophosphoesterase n=1 Tax=Runella sp. TaxID=1960881 RepID=UPI003D0E6B49